MEDFSLDLLASKEDVARLEKGIEELKGLMLEHTRNVNSELNSINENIGTMIDRIDDNF